MRAFFIVVDDEASIACSLFCFNYSSPSVLQSLKKKITTYRRAASHYDKEERNGTETAEPAETLRTKDEGDEGKRKMRVRRRRNEANGHAAKDEDKDEGLCVTCHIILSTGHLEIARMDRYFELHYGTILATKRLLRNLGQNSFPKQSHSAIRHNTDPVPVSTRPFFAESFIWGLFTVFTWREDNPRRRIILAPYVFCNSVYMQKVVLVPSARIFLAERIS